MTIDAMLRKARQEIDDALTVWMEGGDALGPGHSLSPIPSLQAAAATIRRVVAALNDGDK